MKGLNAVVTGATKGIGRAICFKLASLGVNVIVNYRNNEEEANLLAKEIEELGVKANIFKADVSKFEEAQNLIKYAKSEFGSVDVLVNNAGITKDTLILRMKEEDFDSVINTNLKGCFNTSKVASQIMIKQRSGSIINISSVVGITGNAGQCNYSASKAGIIGFSKSLAKELGGRGVRVNCVAPGFIETDMTKELKDEYKESLILGTALKRIGKPEDVAKAVAFLASDESGYITGQVINVDGGMVM